MHRTKPYESRDWWELASDRQAIPVLILLLKDQDPQVSVVAEMALATFHEAAIPPVLGLFKDSNPAVRHRAINALNGVAFYDADRTIPALKEAVNDPDPGVAADAAAVLNSTEDRLKEANQPSSEPGTDKP